MDDLNITIRAINIERTLWVICVIALLILSGYLYFKPDNCAPGTEKGDIVGQATEAETTVAETTEAAETTVAETTTGLQPETTEKEQKAFTGKQIVKIQTVSYSVKDADRKLALFKSIEVKITNGLEKDLDPRLSVYFYDSNDDYDKRNPRKTFSEDDIGTVEAGTSKSVILTIGKTISEADAKKTLDVKMMDSETAKVVDTVTQSINAII